MPKASIKRLAAAIGVACSLAGCAGLRQGESTSRCTDCATALYSDTGSGGSIYNVASQSEEAVRRVARRYCAEHGLGPPVIGNRAQSPLGSDFSEYDFSCGSRDKQVAPQPLGQQPVAPQLPLAGDVEKFGATCAGIGFQKGTPEYDNCVQKLLELRAQAAESAAASLRQLQQRQREQATEAIRQELDNLSAQTPAACQSPMTLTIKLPCGDVVSCSKKGDQVDCN